jgi:hypothetical protein
MKNINFWTDFKPWIFVSILHLSLMLNLIVPMYTFTKSLCSMKTKIKFVAHLFKEIKIGSGLSGSVLLLLLVLEYYWHEFDPPLHRNLLLAFQHLVLSFFQFSVLSAWFGYCCKDFNWRAWSTLLFQKDFTKNWTLTITVLS